MIRQLLLSSLLLVALLATAQKQAIPPYLKGNVFPDSVLQFSVTTTAGTVITLGEVLAAHKGKKIVIDIWASWCKDCLAGMPALDTLMQKSENKNVAYVFLSLDKEEKKWKSAIERLELGGSHYWISEGWKNVFSNYIVLDWIPRYLVLDEKGVVIIPKVVSASDKKLESAILK